MAVSRTELFELLGGWPVPKRGANSVARKWQSLPPELKNASCAVLSDTCRIEHIGIENTRKTPQFDVDLLPAILTLPAEKGPHPVVIYCHAHGARYDIGKQELLTGRPAMPCGGYAVALAKYGIAALCIDIPCFGERDHDKENALGKRLLWHGDTMFGVMLRELATCIDYLDQRNDIDSLRIGAMGLSMGSTLAWWLTALDDRIKVVAEVCCLADLHTLVSTGAHDLHGIYMMVPGLLQCAETKDINSLIAPRPHFCAVGAQDPLTPTAAFEMVNCSMKTIYAELGQFEHWQVLISADSGHEETEPMRMALLTFLQHYL